MRYKLIKGENYVKEEKCEEVTQKYMKQLDRFEDNIKTEMNKNDLLFSSLFSLFIIIFLLPFPSLNKCLESTISASIIFLHKSFKTY